MTDEEKAKAAEAKAKADAEFEVSLEGLSDEEKTQKREEKAEKEAELLQKNAETERLLEQEHKRRESAEAKLEETRRKARERYEERQRRIAAGEAPDDEDKPLTRQELREVLDEERELARKELQQDRAREIARRLAESPSEAELVLEVWKNRTLAGSLEEQMAEAHAIATSRRVKAQNEELKRALLGKEGEGKENLNPQRRPAPMSKEPNLNPTDRTVLTGYVWDNARDAYKKFVAGGRKILFVSRDLKKRWIEDAPKK